MHSLIAFGCGAIRGVDVSTQPSAEYRTHHDVEAPRVDATTFRQGWRVETRLDALYASGAIDEEAYAAAIAYRVTWEMGLGSTSAMRAVVRLSGSPGRGMALRLGAVAKLRRIGAALGPFGCWLVHRCVILDAPWSDTARALSVTDKTAKGWTIAAIRSLAAFRAQRGTHVRPPGQGRVARS